MKFNLDPTIPKVVLIAVLLMLEGFLIPLYTIISQGRLPTELEVLGFLLAGILQFITFMLTFIETGQTPPVPVPKPAASP